MTAFFSMMALAATAAFAAPTIAEAPSTPTVWVDQDDASGDPEVTGWLLVRLLVEGYPVARTEAQANVTLRIDAPTEDNGWRVAADGDSTEQFQVVAEGDPAIARLELLQRAVDAVEAVQPRATAESPSPRFALELAPELPLELRAETERQLADAVLRQGGGLAPTRQGADFVLCGAAGRPTPQLSVVAPEEPCADATLRPPPLVSTSLHARRLVTEALETTTVADPFVTEPEPPLVEGLAEPRPEPEPDEDEARRWPDSRLMIRGGVSGGVMARFFFADAVVAMSGFIGREPGVAGWLDLQIVPSARVPGLRIVDVFPQAGVRLRPLRRHRFALEVGALAGMQLHVFQFSGRVGEQTFSGQGVNFDATGELAVGVSVGLWRDHELSLLARAGRSSRFRAHTLAGASLWERSAWRVGGTLGVTFGRELRR
ncbi:MAG: hypothetical protein AAF721_20465 [Myxococcota bacterium]